MGIIDTVYPEGLPVAKANVRADDKTGHRRNVPDVDTVQNNDFSGQTAGLYVRALQGSFDLDTSDATTAHNGTTVLVDYGGNRFKLVPAPSGDVAGDTHAASSKTTPADADEIPLVDSAASNVLKKLTWANLKAALASTFLTPSAVRERLTANRTYYVAPSGSGGSDSNDGLTNLTPFLTKQKAIDLIIKTLDLAGFTVTIQLADGTYTGSGTFNFPWTGGGAIVIQGNSGTPGNVIISTTSANCFNNNGVLPGILTVKDMELRTTTSGSGISNSGVGSIQFQNINFGACATAHLVTNAKSSKIQAVGNYAINGGSGFHMLSLRGEIEISARTVTLTGTPAFGTAFAYASREGYIGAEANTFSGSATGPRYAVSSNAVIYTGGGGANYFPGNSAGSGTNAGTSPYGLYI